MDEMKVKLTDAVAAKLSAAPASAEKDELIEELSDNLYRRFLDMSGAGMDDEAAFNRSLEDLGDVDELLAYLGVEPGEKSGVVIDRGDGQTRITTPDGHTIVINGADDENIVINTGGPDEAAAQRFAAEAERAEAEAKRAEGEAGAAQGTADGQGGAHYGYGQNGQSVQSDLDAIFANVSEICRIAVDQARDAVKQAKDAIQRRTTVEKDSGHVKVHFNAGPEAPVPPEPPVPPAPPAPPEPPEEPKPGWEFEAELDSDEGRFFAGAGPKQRKDVVYGFGYDKARGGFFAQWGEYQGGDGGAKGPHFSGVDAGMNTNDDGSYSVTALKDLRGIEVHTTSGDVSIHVSEAPDAGVIIDGDVDDLDVTCSADGVLTIREGRTAASSFFSRRGIGSADVELYLPRRHWETITVNTASGDVEIDRDGLDISYLTVTTASGDLRCKLLACGVLSFRSASGDLELSGECAELMASTMSGDIDLQGQIGSAQLNTVSGDIELSGSARQFRAATTSGDLQAEVSILPEILELSTKSGDCLVRLPDAGPFMVRMKTTSGEMDSQFPMNYINGVFAYGGGDGPVYTMKSISGDVSLERR